MYICIYIYVYSNIMKSHDVPTSSSKVYFDLELRYSDPEGGDDLPTLLGRESEGPKPLLISSFLQEAKGDIVRHLIQN